MVKRLIVKINI